MEIIAIFAQRCHLGMVVVQTPEPNAEGSIPVSRSIGLIAKILKSALFVEFLPVAAAG